MKKEYLSPLLRVDVFSLDDLITTSVNFGGGVGDWEDGDLDFDDLS